jgi:Domain of unknown function (DUF4386)
MTHTTNARIAGFTFLFYIAAGIASMVLFSQATGGQEITAKLASIAHHVLQLRLTIVLGLLQAVCAIVLAVTLYAITRDQDSDLAMLALIFRVGEGLLGAISTRGALELLWLGTSVGPKAPDAVTLQALGTYLLDGPDWNMGAILFAMGSTLFSYLFLRGRTIPVPLAWLGVIASVLLVVDLPLQLAGFLRGPVTSYVWIPMAAFEVPLGFWLLIKGVRTPAAD